MRVLPLTIALLTTGCDPGAITKNPIVSDLLGKLTESVGRDTVERLTSGLKEATDDVGVTGMASEESCQMYTDKGRAIAEAAWAHDWPVFAPMLATPPDAESDQAFCRNVIESRGARILTKPEGLRHSTAIVFAVLLDPDFEDLSERRQAAIMCHEAAHIVWQMRVGLVQASKDYKSVSGRIATEAAAYAWGDLVLRRNGVTPEWITGARESRAVRFPETYALTRTFTPQCVYEYLTKVSQELQNRVGQ